MLQFKKLFTFISIVFFCLNTKAINAQSAEKKGTKTVYIQESKDNNGFLKHCLAAIGGVAVLGLVVGALTSVSNDHNRNTTQNIAPESIQESIEASLKKQKIKDLKNKLNHNSKKIEKFNTKVKNFNQKNQKYNDDLRFRNGFWEFVKTNTVNSGEYSKLDEEKKSLLKKEEELDTERKKIIEELANLGVNIL
ncbi:MAG: insecticidal delta-endotoxin Cry8Ea1 family protein [Bacteroidota bacterium]